MFDRWCADDSPFPIVAVRLKRLEPRRSLRADLRLKIGCYSLFERRKAFPSKRQRVDPNQFRRLVRVLAVLQIAFQDDRLFRGMPGPLRGLRQMHCRGAGGIRRENFAGYHRSSDRLHRAPRSGCPLHAHNGGQRAEISVWKVFESWISIATVQGLAFDIHVGIPAKAVLCWR